MICVKNNFAYPNNCKCIDCEKARLMDKNNSDEIKRLKKEIAKLKDIEHGYPKAIAGLKIKAAREAEGITQAELAEPIEKPRTTITNIETGSQGLTVKALIGICRVLNIDANDLLEI